LVHPYIWLGEKGRLIVKNPKSEQPRRGRPPQASPRTDTEQRVGLAFQVSAKTRRLLDELAREETAPLARVTERLLEEAITLKAWLAALKVEPGKLGDDRLEELLTAAGWNNPAPNVWLRPVRLTATGIAGQPAVLERPTSTVTDPNNKERKS
jgi:hypothetical protein